MGIFDCIGNHSEYYWMIWLFCTIHWLFLCGVNSSIFLFGGIVGSSSVRPIENKILCADHPMLNRKPSSTEIHTHILSFLEAITVTLLSLGKMAELPHRAHRPIYFFVSFCFFVFILMFGPIEIKAIDLTCALVLAICIIIMLLIFDIVP